MKIICLGHLIGDCNGCEPVKPDKKCPNYSPVDFCVTVVVEKPTNKKKPQRK
jgi:hypothetical protein